MVVRVEKVVPLILTIVPLTLVTVFLITLNPSPSFAVTELCNPNKSKVVYQFSVEQCPFGVLFAIPVKAECLKSSADNDMANFYADLCENTKFEPDVSKQIQMITTLTDGTLSEKDSCKGTEANQCDVELKPVKKSDITEPGEDASIAEEENFEETEIDIQRRNNTMISEQTLRMFKFIVGLEGDVNFVDEKIERKKRSLTATSASDVNVVNNTKNYDHEGPNIRVTELLKLSFKILGKHCDNGYVSKEFNRDVQRMFLFLLRESSTGQIEDVSVEEYTRIKKALDDCLAKDPVFILNGTACRTYSRVKLIEKFGQTSVYLPNEFSYNPYQHDVPIDATWGTSDFVHGLCYGTFREHINSHHLYQRAVERLFNNQIIYRWSRPPKLLHEELWNNMLSANVRPTMKNLDVCIHAAYYDTPFIHRLERPLTHFVAPTNKPGQVPGGNNPPGGGPVPSQITTQRPSNIVTGTKQTTTTTTTAKPLTTQPPAGRRRRKRSTSLSLDDTGLSEAGWCFQKEIEQKKIVRAYIEANCPESGALTQFQDNVQSVTEPSDEKSDSKTSDNPEGSADENPTENAEETGKEQTETQKPEAAAITEKPQKPDAVTEKPDTVTEKPEADTTTVAPSAP